MIYTEAKQKELEEAILKNKIEVARKLLEDGVELRNKAVIDTIARDRSCVPFFKLVEEYGYDLTQRGFVILFQAALSVKLKNVEFLVEKIKEKDTNAVYLSLINLTTAYISDSEKTKPIIDLLTPHITKEKLDKVLKLLEPNKSSKDYIMYVTNSWLNANLEKKDNVSLKRSKI